MQGRTGPLFGMTKAEIVEFSIEMGAGTSVRTIPHTTLTASDLANYESIQRGQAPGPVPADHDHYDEESDADTDMTNELYDGFRIFTEGGQDVAFTEVEEIVFDE